ncbi:hypothetical protein RB195_018976 [Necator americanus]|uniref:Uncharacterized protein n=1 Tax=Necator americanus TaxID=51031 RepID=A0ABR1CE33_NECAM
MTDSKQIGRVTDVMCLSLFIQKHGLAGLPLFRNLAFRQVTCKEPRQGVDEYWRKAIQVFWSYSVGIGCGTISYRHDSMSYFGRKNLCNDMSVFPQMVRRQVDMVVERIRVEVVDDFLLLDAIAVPFGFRRAVILVLRLAKSRRA